MTNVPFSRSPSLAVSAPATVTRVEFQSQTTAHSNSIFLINAHVQNKTESKKTTKQNTLRFQITSLKNCPHQKWTQRKRRRPSGRPCGSPHLLAESSKAPFVWKSRVAEQDGMDRQHTLPPTLAPHKHRRSSWQLCASVRRWKLWLPRFLRKKRQKKKKKLKKPWCRARGGACALLQAAVLGAARSCREAELLQVGDAVEVDESTRHHQDVEELVGVELEEEEKRWGEEEWEGRTVERS